MSLAAKRQVLAAALSTVDGITGYPKRPTVITVGSAWVLWRGMEPDSDQRITWRHTWAVVVVVGDSEDAADAFVAERADELADALHFELYVTSIQPAVLPAEGGQMYALTLTGESE
jgi:hypothetical protein